MEKSKLFSLSLSDVWKGLIMTFLGALVSGVMTVIQSGVFAFDWITFKPILMGAIGAGLAYILKNFFSNSNGQFATKEKS